MIVKLSSSMIIAAPPKMIQRFIAFPPVLVLSIPNLAHDVLSMPDWLLLHERFADERANRQKPDAHPSPHMCYDIRAWKFIRPRLTSGPRGRGAMNRAPTV
jgi:hypothetical protein